MESEPSWVLTRCASEATGRPRRVIPRSAGPRSSSFADADAPSDPRLVLFDRERAITIRDFVLAHRDRAERIVVHCDAGLSRSPAVAAAITKALGGDDAPWFKRYRPNALVYRKLVEVCSPSWSERA